jgi:hypothetical protein
MEYHTKPDPRAITPRKRPLTTGRFRHDTVRHIRSAVLLRFLADIRQDKEK